MSYKKVREELERRYGKECFIDKLHLRKDDVPRTYTSKGQMKKMKQLTYHHIEERSKGGKATVKNGAPLSLENHIWFNEQSEEDQENMNGLFQKYKKQVDEIIIALSGECKIIPVDDLEVPYEIKPMEFSIDDRKKGYDRNAKKREDKELIREYEEEER